MVIQCKQWCLRFTNRYKHLHYEPEVKTCSNEAKKMPEDHKVVRCGRCISSSPFMIVHKDVWRCPCCRGILRTSPRHSPGGKTYIKKRVKRID